MKWLENIKEYEKTGNSGKCPFCKSENIETLELHEGRKSLTFICRNCGKSEHIDYIHSVQ